MFSLTKSLQVLNLRGVNEKELDVGTNSDFNVGHMQGDFDDALQSG